MTHLKGTVHVEGRWRLPIRWLALVAVLAVSGVLAPHEAGAGTVRQSSDRPGEKSKSLAQVKYIYLGLSVKPPSSKTTVKGKVKMPLYSKYFLQTKVKQRASIRFSDGTTLHMNQRTDAVLKSSNLTVVKKGTVDEMVTPGTNHQVQTATAVAAAIGTNFVVQKIGNGTRIITVQGAVQVRNKRGSVQGSVVVKTNQASIVLPNQQPQPPQHVDASKYVTWTKGMPHPKQDQNLALDANGGTVVDKSSEYTSPTQGDFWRAANVIDGRLDWGWESASGEVSDQWIKIGFKDNKIHTVKEVIIDPASTHDIPPIPSADLKTFDIRVSTATTSEADFHTVYHGVCQDQDTPQLFKFDKPAQAKYVELYMYDNYGSPDWMAVAEFEVIGT